jgi:polar amino acid transport system substrate-binding protein
MRRLFFLSTLVMAGALLVTAIASAHPDASVRRVTARSTTPKLPTLPANIRARGRWNIGVKCDVPPFGYIDVKGKNEGFDVEIGRQFARYAFGRATSVNFLCAPTAAREPLLTSGRADLVISTFTYTTDRATRIDFSRPYYKATGRLLVPDNGPIQKLSDIAGRRVATTSGSIYDRWMRNCFKTTQVLATDTLSNAILAYQQGRVDAVMYDDAALLPIAAADRNSKLTNDTFLQAPYGIGIAKGNTALKAWVDSRLNLMRQHDMFLPILKSNVAPRFLSSFEQNILRPNNTFSYAPAGSPSIETVCPS